MTLYGTASRPVMPRVGTAAGAVGHCNTCNRTNTTWPAVAGYDPAATVTWRQGRLVSAEAFIVDKIVGRRKVRRRAPLQSPAPPAAPVTTLHVIREYEVIRQRQGSPPMAAIVDTTVGRALIPPQRWTHRIP